MKKRDLLRKRGIAAIGAAVMMAALLAGCGGAGSSTAETKEAGAQTEAAGAETKALELPGTGPKETEAKDDGAKADAGAPAAEQEAAGKEEEAAQQSTAEKKEEKEEEKAEEKKEEKTEEKTEQKAEEKEGSAAAEDEEIRQLHLETNQAYHGWYDPELNPTEFMSCASVTQQRLYLDPEDEKKYPELQKAVSSFQEKRFALMMKDLGEQIPEAEELFQSNPDMELYDNAQCLVRRADSEVLSFVVRTEIYYGGVHPTTVYEGFNFDTKTGEEIRIQDVIREPAGLTDLISEVMSAEEGEKYDLDKENVDQNLKEFKPEDLNFTLEQDGIRFWFSPYDIAAYASGMFSAELTYADYPEIFTEKYQNAPKCWAKNCPLYEDTKFRRTGKLRKMSVDTVVQDDYGMYDEIVVHLDQNELHLDVEGWKAEPYLFCNDGKYWLYLFSWGDNDYTSLHVIDINGMDPEEVRQIGGVDPDYRVLQEIKWEEYDYTKAHEEENLGENERTILPTDPMNLKLAVWSELLSTYSASGEYKMGNDGAPVALKDYFEIHAVDLGLILKQDTEFQEVDPETLEPKGGAGKGEMLSLKAGTHLKFYRNDNISTVWMLLEDGRCVRVDIDSTDWPQRVNGIETTELFDGMVFAG